jgi:membrane protein YqaA with SNARE-associated domain
MSPERRLTILRLLSLLLVVGIAVVIFIFRDQIKNLAQYGYLGIFLATLISNATVFVPVPGVMVVFAMGAVFHPIPTAIAAGLGGATGELSGYLLGFSGQGVAERSERFQQVYGWMAEHRRWSDLAILVLAATPNPFFDMAGIAAGMLKIPIYRFWFFCAIGSIIKYMVFALAGNTTLNFLFK